MADLLRSRWHRFCPPPSFQSFTFPQYSAFLGTCVWDDTWPLHAAHQHGTSPWPWSSDRKHLTSPCISLCSALCNDAALRAPAAPPCCRGCPGAGMVPSVTVAAVMEHTLPCPPSVCQLGHTGEGLAALRKRSATAAAVPHPTCAALQVPSHPELQ